MCLNDSLFLTIEWDLICENKEATVYLCAWVYSSILLCKGISKQLCHSRDSGQWSSLKDALIPSKTLMPHSTKTQKPWGSEHSCLGRHSFTEETVARHGVYRKLLGLISLQKSGQLCTDPKIFPPGFFSASSRRSHFLHSWWGFLDTGIA